MKVRKTLTSVIVSLVIVLGVLALALAVGAGNIIQQRIPELLSSFNKSSSSFEISYDSINPRSGTGVSVLGLQVKSGEKPFISISEVKISASLFDLGRMLFGIDPETVKVTVNGVSLSADDSFLDSLIDRISPEKETDTGSSQKIILSKTESNKAFSLNLPFAVEISVKEVTADVDVRGYRCSVGNISAFARLERKGLAIANAVIPSAIVTNDDRSYFADDIRISADSSLKLRLSADILEAQDLVRAEGTSAVVELSGDTVKAAAEIDEISGFGSSVSNAVLNCSYSESIIRADLTIADGTYSSDYIPFKNIGIKDLKLSSSLSDSKTLLVNSGFEISADSISSKASFSAEFSDINNIKDDSEMTIKLSDTVTPVIDIANTFTLRVYDMDKITLKGTVTKNFDVSSSVSLSDRKAYASVIINSVPVTDFKKGIEHYIPFLKNKTENSADIDGKILFNGKIGDEHLEGGLSIDFALNGLDGKGSDNPVNFNVLAQAGNGILYVENCSLDGFGFSAGFKGSLDAETFSPKGEMFVKENKTGENIAKAVFSRHENSFDVKVTSQKVKRFEIDTFVSWDKTGNVEVDSNIITKSKSYPVVISLDTSESFKIKIEDGDNSVELSMGDDGDILFESLFNGFELMIDNETALLLSGRGSGVINIGQRKVDFSLKDSFISVSDYITVGFDFSIDNKKTRFSDVNIYIKNAGYPIKGYLEINYKEIANLASIDFAAIPKLDIEAFSSSLSSENFEIRSEMKSDNGDNFTLYYKDNSLLVTASSNLFNYPVDLKVFGSRNDGFFADISLGTISFEASYSEGRAKLYKVNGSIGAFDLEGMELELDTRQRTLEGAINLNHTFHNKTGDVSSRADIVLNAKLETLGGLFDRTLLSGADYYVDLTVKNASLGDTEIPDTDLVLIHSDGVYAVSGNMINGQYRSSDGFVEIKVDPSFTFGFEAKGHTGESCDIAVRNIFFPVQMVNPFLNEPILNLKKGDITGDVLIHGPKNDLMYYGMLYCSSFGIDLFYCPDQVITAKNIAVSINEHTVSIPSCPVVGYSKNSSEMFEGNLSVEAVIQGTEFESFDIMIEIGDRPLSLWLPMHMDENLDFNISGECSDSWVRLYIDNTGKVSFSGDAKLDDLYFTFEVPEMPAWYYEKAESPVIDFVIRTGRNCEVSYPSLDDPLVSLTANEGESVNIKIDSLGNFSSDGFFSVKTGRVYYFNNDFYVTDGHIYFEKNPFSDQNLEIYIDVAAKTRQYDANGEPLDIYLNINKATFDNMSTRFSSSSGLSENEIIQILGQAMLPTQEGLTLSSVASVAYAATEAAQKLNLVESNKTFSLSATIREALDLDFLSAKSPLLANILVDALPGSSKDIGIIARYLNGTSLFAGKYFTPDVFGRITVLLSADSSSGNSKGYFISEDLSLDVEMSLEWETPFATWTLSMAPDELSVFSFLDTIGITVSKAFRY